MLRNMEKNVFIHSFIVYGQSCVYTQLFRLRPKCGIAQASSRLSFPALVPASFRTAWFPPPAPTDLSHGFSTILAKHKTDQTEPPKHNTHLVFFDLGQRPLADQRQS